MNLLKQLLKVSMAGIAVLGLGVSGLFYYGFPPFSVQGGSTAGPQAPSNTQYDCATPAINTQNFCDTLPQGYKIPTRLPNAPPAACPSGMSASACQVLKLTYGNGVCDPNETVWTSPLDCGCGGANIGDPFTGRCGAPATVCQLAASRKQYG